MRVLGLILLIVFAGDAAAWAQQRHSVGGGGRWSYPAGSPSLEGTPGVEVSYRGWLSPRVGIETFGSHWRHRTGREADANERSYTARESRFSFGAGVIGRLPVGRVSFVLGGGPGYFMDVETHRVLLGQQWRELTSTRGGWGAQTILELDVRLTPTLSAFAGARGEIRDITYGIESAVAYPTAGIRFEF